MRVTTGTPSTGCAGRRRRRTTWWSRTCRTPGPPRAPSCTRRSRPGPARPGTRRAARGARRPGGVPPPRLLDGGGDPARGRPAHRPVPHARPARRRGRRAPAAPPATGGSSWPPARAPHCASTRPGRVRARSPTPPSRRTPAPPRAPACPGRRRPRWCTPGTPGEPRTASGTDAPRLRADRGTARRRLGGSADMEHEVFVPVEVERLREVLDDPARVALGGARAPARRRCPRSRRRPAEDPRRRPLRHLPGRPAGVRAGRRLLRRRGRRGGDPRHRFGEAGAAAAPAGGGGRRHPHGRRHGDGRRPDHGPPGGRGGLGGDPPAEPFRENLATVAAEPAGTGRNRPARRPPRSRPDRAPAPSRRELLATGDFEPRATTDFETTPDGGPTTPRPRPRPPAPGPAEAVEPVEPAEPEEAAPEPPGPAGAAEGAVPEVPSVFDVEVPPPSLGPAGEDEEDEEDVDRPGGPDARRAVDDRPQRRGGGPCPAPRPVRPRPRPQTVSPRNPLRWAAPAAALAVASAVVAVRALRRRHSAGADRRPDGPAPP
ncbi:hypothetical protein SGRIM128S_05495 [Streptomyces griseomycini]